MRDFRKEEALWEPENGMDNAQEKLQTAQQTQDAQEVQQVRNGSASEEFELPDIPAIFPNQSAHEKENTVKADKKESAEAEEPRIWSAKNTKKQVKEAKKKYREEKKRLRREQHMRSPGWRKVLVTGVICALVGGAIGTVVTLSTLTVAQRIFHIDLLGLRPEQIQVVREQYVAKIQEYKSPGTAVYKKNCNSVVRVEISGSQGDSVWDGQTVANRVTSGAVYSTDGYILVNADTVCKVLQPDGTLGKDASISVYIPQEENTAYAAVVAGYDWEWNVALLKIDATGLYAVEVADTGRIQPGETVFTIAYENGSNALCIMDGMLSLKQSDIWKINRTEQNLYRGSPLFSAGGQFIGMNSTENENSVIPANQIVQVCNSILNQNGG